MTPAPTLTPTQKAAELVHALVRGAECTAITLDTNKSHTVVSCHVRHPKRTLTPSSFANKAKKLGMVAYGTRSATGPTLIVAYINIDRTTEMRIQGTNCGAMDVRVSFSHA